jgi:hypothetical protein
MERLGPRELARGRNSRIHPETAERILVVCWRLKAMMTKAAQRLGDVIQEPRTRVIFRVRSFAE